MSNSNAAADEFPTFKDADVLMISLTGKIWKLHSRVLANGSPVFKEIFTKNAPARIRKEDRLEGNLIQWKLHMVKQHAAVFADVNGSHYVDFMVVDLHKKQPVNLGIFNGMGEPPKFNTIYDNLFRVFYNLRPDFTPIGDTGIDEEAAPMYEALNLLTAAGYLKAYPSVCLIVECFLLEFNQLLWYEVEHKPEVWASVACKLQSAIIFREAMLHLAGRYHLRGFDGVKQYLLANVEWGAAIFNLVKQKGRELKDYKLQTERYLFEYVPERMIHEAKLQVGGTVAPGRAVYANDVYWWMALHLIRQYFSCAVLQNQHHRAADGGMSFYRTIASPHSYLLDNALEGFHSMFAMTPKSRVVFVHALNELKKDVAPIVAGLLVNHSQAQKAVDAAPYKYLTCTVVLDEELPWVEAPTTKTIETISMGATNSENILGESSGFMAVDEQSYSHPTNSGTSLNAGGEPLVVNVGAASTHQSNQDTNSYTLSPTIVTAADQGSLLTIRKDLLGEGWAASAARAASRRRFTASTHTSLSKPAVTWSGREKPSAIVGVSNVVDEEMKADDNVARPRTPVSANSVPQRRPASPSNSGTETHPAKRAKTVSSTLLTPNKFQGPQETLADRIIELDRTLPPASLNTARIITRSRSELEMNSKTAHILASALALDLVPAVQRKEINAKAQDAHDKGVPNMQGLLEKPYGKTNREGLNVKFRAFVEAGMFGSGKHGAVARGESDHIEDVERMIFEAENADLATGRPSSTSNGAADDEMPYPDLEAI